MSKPNQPQSFMSSINLLPHSVISERKKSASANVINRFAIICLVALAFLTGIVLTIRIMQRLELQTATDYLSEVEAKVNSYQDKEAQLLNLKQYLSSINAYSQSDAKKKAVFNLVAFLAPSDVTLSEVTVGTDGSMIVSGQSSSLTSVDKLISELTSRERVGDVISKVELEGLSLGKESLYRFGLKVTVR